jgi:hypothetical protein
VKKRGSFWKHDETKHSKEQIMRSSVVKAIIVSVSLATLIPAAFAAKECYAPDPLAQRRAFSRAVTTEGGKQIWLGGQTGAPNLDFEGQVRQIFAELDASYVGLQQSGIVLLAAYIGGIGHFIGPVLGAILVTYLQIMLSDVTEIWQLYFGLMFIAVVMFAPGGLAGLLMMHTPLMGARVLHLLLVPYALLLAAASIAVVGAIVIVELTHRLAVQASEGSVMRLFGISLDAASAWPWLVAAALAAGGALLMRAAWPMAARALDATAAAHTGERR